MTIWLKELEGEKTQPTCFVKKRLRMQESLLLYGAAGELLPLLVDLHASLFKSMS
jgi:hypothetical protein